MGGCGDENVRLAGQCTLDLDDALSRSATTKLLNSAELTRIKRRRMNPLFNKVDT
jgi:hypothetical protein